MIQYAQNHGIALCRYCEDDRLGTGNMRLNQSHRYHKRDRLTEIDRFVMIPLNFAGTLGWEREQVCDSTPPHQKKFF